MSPCLHICKLDADDTCLGCLRTLDEITDWSIYTTEEKQSILDRILLSCTSS
jgi:predicted Fe-S protein YdhL (DUF1289 family)